jgi:hypothetical protein
MTYAPAATEVVSRGFGDEPSVWGPLDAKVPPGTSVAVGFALLQR